jgi:phosphatidylglycerophosphate synthase
MGVTPNAISLFSIVFALLSAAALVSIAHVNAPVACGLFVLAAVGIQGRLICNLLDGMVAIEGGKKSKVGDLYNEFPDRVADSLVLIATGYAAGGEGIWLGWCAALLAALTAYVRVAGKAAGSRMHFAGPMAKQHRMALLTLTFLLCCGLVFINQHRVAMLVCLIVINVGCVLTLIRRTRLISTDLHAT